MMEICDRADIGREFFIMNQSIAYVLHCVIPAAGLQRKGIKRIAPPPWHERLLRFVRSLNVGE
jgi:hypothetical protein